MFLKVTLKDSLKKQQWKVNNFKALSRDFSELKSLSTIVEKVLKRMNLLNN